MLKTLVGPRKSELMLQARLVLGESVEMVDTRTIMLDDGSELYALLASDGEEPPSDNEILAAWGIRPAHCLLMPGPRDLVRPVAPGEPMTIAFVGPPGAGKTTTMAKLALHQRVFGEAGLRIGFACLDTYRAGAMEQLRLYADVAGAQFTPIYSIEDAERLRDAARDLDVLLVDAPGRAWRQEEDLAQVKLLLHALQPNETHLVLPSGLRPATTTRWVNWAQRHLQSLTHLLPTKVDESPDDWAAFDLGARHRLPIRWMGEGQDIPTDMRAGLPRLARAILGHSTRLSFGALR